MKWPPENLDELLKRSAEVLRDLAVSGLPPRSYIPAKVEVGNLFGRSVDLVDLDLETPFTHYLKTKEGILRRVVVEDLKEELGEFCDQMDAKSGSDQVPS